jgi:hypothetical protein
MRHRLFLTLVSAAVLWVATPMAHASIIATFTGETTVGVNDYQFNYTDLLTGDQQCLSASTCEQVFYDVQGFIPGSQATTSPGWTASYQYVGPVPFGTALTDSASLYNVVFICTACNLGPGPVTLAGTFSFQSTYNGVTTLGEAAAQAVKYDPGNPDNGTTTSNVQFLTEPSAATSVPEPMTLAFAGFGLLGIAAGVYRRHTKRGAKS